MKNDFNPPSQKTPSVSSREFHLLVKSREGVIFDDEVESLSSFNEEGEFDILARHANFISLIQKRLVIRDKSGDRKEIPVHNALLRMKGNRVEVYLGVAGLRPSAIKTAEVSVNA